MVDSLRFKNTKFVKIDSNFSVPKVIKILGISIFSHYESYDNYILGDYFSKVLRLSTIFIRRRKLILLDDGVATLEIQRELLSKNLALNLFTIFDISPIQSQHIIKHSFSNLINNCKVSMCQKSNIFIGGPLVENGLLTPDKYLNIVRKAAKRSEVLLYFPHRREASNYIDIVGTIENVEIVNPDVCIEYYLLKQGVEPNMVYSIFSTVLFTIKIIFPMAKVVAYKPIFNDVKSERDPLYDSMRSLSITVLEC